MRVIVCGSRGWTDGRAIADRLRDLPLEVVVVHGACPEGADAAADRAARRMGLRIERHHADWETLGRKAGPWRNEEMAVAGADLCVAFWDGSSKGTMDMVTRAVQHGIPVEIIPKEA